MGNEQTPFAVEAGTRWGSDPVVVARFHELNKAYHWAVAQYQVFQIRDERSKRILKFD